MSKEKTIYDESFFNNSNIPYCVKAGMVSVLSGLTINIGKNTFGEDMFCAQKFGNDKRPVGTVMFTFGAPESMGKNNCLASLKSFETETLEKAFAGIVDGQMKADSEICEQIANSVVSSLNLSADGAKEHWNKIISVNFDKYVKTCRDNYNGMLSENLVNSLKDEATSAFSKKKQMTALEQA